MRTAEQGQAAAPRERDARRRGKDLPGSSAWVVGEYLTDCHTFVERYQILRPILRAAGFADYGRFHRERPFFVVLRCLPAC